MSRPLFLADDVSQPRVELTGAEARHAAAVRRISPGEQIDVADGRGTRVTGVVTDVGRERVVVDVVTRVSEPLPAPRVVLVQALAKGERSELAVELATELGVDEVVPWAAQRCVVTWRGERGEKSRARWQATAREAAKQSRRAFVPHVAPLAATGDVATRVAHAAAAFVLHEASDVPFAHVQLPDDGDLLLVVGPEGGITDDEVRAFADAGAVAVRLGHHVVRTSTAGGAALAVVNARTSRWS